MHNEEGRGQRGNRRSLEAVYYEMASLVDPALGDPFRGRRHKVRRDGADGEEKMAGN